MPSNLPPRKWVRNSLVNSEATAASILKQLAAFLRVEAEAGYAYLDWLQARFDLLESNLQAFLPEPDRFTRLRQEVAALIDQHPEPAQRPPLFGLPLGVKDIFHVDGFDTRAGSQLPTEALVGDQASCVRALRDSGGLILGKTVTTEFAYFAPGPTRNPHNEAHTPGGSSSGSAAAVAAGLAPFALGTQTIGSINRPASFCGTVGFKPTYARISPQGVIPLSPSLDHIGYFTPDAASAAWLAPLLIHDWRAAEKTEKSLRLAIPTGPYLEHVETEALTHFRSDCELLRKAGHEVLEIPAFSDFEVIVENHNIILAFEAARAHQVWFKSFSESYHPKTAALIQQGENIAAAALEKAFTAKDALREKLDGMMEEHAIHAWITPSAPGPAPEGLESTGDPVMNLPWTQSGMPTVTLPSGKTAAHLPLGIQLAGRNGKDEQLLAFASLLEGALKYESIHDLREFLYAQQ